MSAFGGSFWKSIFPFLWIGGTGTGIKLYMKDGSLLDADLLVFSSDSKVVTPNPKPATQDAQTSVVDPESKDQTTSSDTTTSTQPPSPPSPPSTPPVEDKSYGGALKKISLKIVDENTTDDVMKNILIQRMYPHYMGQITYQPNRLFTGSQQIIMRGKNYATKDDKTLFVLDQPTKEETDKLKQSCIAELPKDKENDQQLLKLKEWCTEPTVKAVLERHKFSLLKTDDSTHDDQWKEIIGGGWFGDDYKNQQTFISDTDLDKFKGITGKDSVTDEHIGILKNKCKAVVTQPYVKNYFPATQDFINNLKDDTSKSRFKGIDTFQQAALFCTTPKTAEDYAQTGMHGKGADSIETKFNKDYCYDTSKDVTAHKQIKTYDPFGGKSFWCAVRVVYAPKSKK